MNACTRHSSRFVSLRPLAAFAIAVLLSPDLRAQSNQFGTFVSTSRIPLTATVDDPERGITAQIEPEETLGFGVSYSRFWTRNLATEISIQQANSDVQARVNAGALGVALGIGTLDVTALSALLQWHWNPEAMISPWAGAGIVLLDAELNVPRQVAELAELEDADLGQAASWLLNAGVSFRITERIRIAADVKYTRYEPDSPTPVIPDGEAIHPLLFGAGLRFRF